MLNGEFRGVAIGPWPRWLKCLIFFICNLCSRNQSLFKQSLKTCLKQNTADILLTFYFILLHNSYFTHDCTYVNIVIIIRSFFFFKNIYL